MVAQMGFGRRIRHPADIQSEAKPAGDGLRERPSRVKPECRLRCCRLVLQFPLLTLATGAWLVETTLDEASLP
jgi:hypothetical protein